jgi:hypothetical protein
MFMRLNRRCAHHLRPPDGGNGFRSPLPAVPGRRSSVEAETRALLKGGGTSLAVYPAVAFALIYFAVRLAIRHDLDKRPVAST